MGVGIGSDYTLPDPFIEFVDVILGRVCGYIFLITMYLGQTELRSILSSISMFKIRRLFC